ncbi:Gfo/Idh/MocA family protein [Diplocloster agilis]|uniref:Gfo/Idh/MocA family protein n=1 Tax=Diplocloster agilis TaxID=2850323 RepID=UPI000820EA63|nr:Gfo/Idh/MocA family oxidoreductase [Suonthocola fibrivorans]MCU6732329.1 Gfo/Idh/MocA family oxidoreductase [Suonthocola fibrivorans]SCI43537.1 1%2C5-anhydro-D-fructose reductase [uncultured Clostridium sp.]
MRYVNVGIIGLGFIGQCHIDAVRRIGCARVTAVADADYGLAKRKALELGIPNCYETADELIHDPEIDVIHDCTPNHLHMEINEKSILAGKHIFSEKPLGMNSAESARMLTLLKEHPGVLAGVNYCYRMNALIQDAKNRIAAGEIGRPYLIHGSYLQDWMLYDTDYNWRVEEEYAGISRTVADIGTHWMDTAQVLAGCRITEVCANTVTALPYRKKPTRQVETFAKAAADQEYDLRPVTTEDYAGVLVRFENGASGVFQCSQISAGRKCFIDIEVDGSAASFQWQHQTSDRMWMGKRDANNEEIMRNPNLMTPEARKYTYLAAGHPEGWNDAMRNNLSAFYRDILEGAGDGPVDYATFEDGHYLMKLTEAIMESGRQRRWVPVQEG